jgi:hypothetical protein
MADEETEIVLPLPPGTEITYEDVAEAARKSFGALAPAILENVSQTSICENGPGEAMAAIAAGALAWSVDAYFRYWTALGLSPGKIRAQMNREIDGFWKQSLSAGLRRATERKPH